MALANISDKNQLIVHGSETNKPKAPKPTVLEEDQYVSALEEIITRDFFPDLPKLRLNEELQNAAKAGDMEKMREIQRKISQLPGEPKPPFDPDEEQEEPPPPSITANHSLDSFQRKFTSEDDAAFSTIMGNEADTRQKKLWYKTGMEKRLLLEGKDPEWHLLTWEYKPENALMFHPETLPVAAPVQPTELDHSNTRFDQDMWDEKNVEKRKKALENYQVLDKDQMPTFNQEKKFFNLDDLMDPSGSDTSGQVAIPSIEGYSLLLPPTPEPVKGKTIVTWGSIQGTPVALEPQTPAAHAPSFTVAPNSRREEAAQRLADKAQHSLKKKKIASGSVTPVPLTPTTPGMAAPTRSLASQRLLDSIKRKQGGDSMLRASYTPNRTPSRASELGGFATPTVTPSSLKRQLQATPNANVETEWKKKKVKKEPVNEMEDVILTHSTPAETASRAARAARLGHTATD